jgi:uncharacterized protein YjbJ (UPF0337 family)
MRTKAARLCTRIVTLNGYQVSAAILLPPRSKKVRPQHKGPGHEGALGSYGYSTTRRKQMNPSTKDEIKGTVHEVKGKVKETAGKVTNNPNLQAEGNAEKNTGKVEKKVGQIEKVFEK